MPEGPEVATIGDWLHLQLVGKTITSIQLNNYNRSNASTLLGLPQSKVEGVCTHGKKIFICTSDYVLQSSLAMTGKWTYTLTNTSKIALTLCENSIHGIIHYNPIYFDDKLGMGWLHVFTYSEYYDKRAKSPPCLIRDNVTFETFVQRIMWDKPLYLVLNDQKIIEGIGNYLRAEILYAAKLSPHRLVTSLSQEDLWRLYNCTMTIMKKAYECGGCALRDYTHPEGKERSTYSIYLRVYGRVDGISADGHAIVNEILLGDTNNQKMWWCPSIQL
jgi:formamidopyrimidine-DNA glycosylase